MKTVRSILAHIEEQESLLLKALIREVPLGSKIYWEHASFGQQGTVRDRWVVNGECVASAHNTRTGRTVRIRYSRRIGWYS